VIFQDGDRRHLGFEKKIEIVTVCPLQRANLRHRAKFHEKSIKRLLRDGDLTVFFQNGGRPPSWICRARIGTTHEDYSVVFIVVLNLVGIAAVLSII